MIITSLTFPIPKNSSPSFLKKIGDTVRQGEPILKYNAPQEKIEIDIAGSLKVSPKTATRLLLKNLGDFVEQEEVIARHTKGFLFKKTLEVKSLFPGKIFELDNFSGKVKIAGVPKETVYASPVAGKIKEEGENGITIEFKGISLTPIKIFGNSFFAPLHKVGGGGEEVDSEKINVSMKGKILYGGHFSLSDLNKAMAVGARGIIASELTDASLEKFVNAKTFSFVDENCKMFLSVAVLDPDSCLKLEKMEQDKELYFDAQSSKIIIPQ